MSSGSKYYHANSVDPDSVASGQDAIAMGPNAVASGKNSIAMGNGATASADNSVALGANSVADGAGLKEAAYNPGSADIAGVKPVGEVSIGSGGAERRLTNVAAGSAPTDAVNVSQLKAVQGVLENKVSQVATDASAGTAAALAAATIPQSIHPGKGFVGMAMGTYNGQSAMALGASKVSDNGRWIYKANVTADTRNNVGAAVGAGFQW